MSVIGKMTRSKDKVLKPGLRDQSTKASMRKDKRKGQEHITGPMGVSILETGTTIRLMELVSTNGKTVQSTMEVGKIMTWMAWVFIFIRMELLMKASTKMTKKQDHQYTQDQDRLKEIHIQQRYKVLNNKDISYGNDRRI